MISRPPYSNAFALFLVVASCIISPGVNADEEPGTGKLLVATEVVGGPVFAETVILLLRFDDSGALGLVVNRPTEAAPEEVMPELEGIRNYAGTLYWGGPVQLYNLRVLLRADSPPEASMPVFGNVYLGLLTETLVQKGSDTSNLRFYLGYAGWAPGQLELEMAQGSWHIVKATEDLVFSEDPARIWRRLAPPKVFRASL